MMELHQIMRENWSLPRKSVRAIMKQTEGKRLQVRMITRTRLRKKLNAHNDS